jgi:hypothetical protein
MHKLVKEKIESLENSIEVVKSLSPALEVIDKVLPDTHIWIDYEINITTYPKSKDEVKDVLKKLAKEGIKLVKFIESNTNPVWQLRGLGADIRFQPQWSTSENASCRLVKIGEITSNKYKLVCNEEEADFNV